MNAGQDSPTAPVAAAAADVAHDTASPWQAELLDLAYEAVSAMPLNPHVKNRSRGQEEVVVTALGIDAPHRAARYADGIDNWRRAAAYADIAYHHALRGEEEEARSRLDQAIEELKQPFGEVEQQWRRDRVRGKIARVHLELGEAGVAAEFGAELETAQALELATAAAREFTAEQCDAHLANLPAIAQLGDFDRLKLALQTCATLYDQYWDDAERRESIVTAIRDSWAKLPAPERIALLVTLSGHADEHGDSVTALAFVDEAREQLAAIELTPEYRVQLMGLLAQARARAGAVDQARREIEAAHSMYQAEKSLIVDVRRAGTLRPLAEAWVEADDAEAARATYLEAVEAGFENPNSRPRALDLASTLCSMVEHGVQADAAMLARIRELADGLGDPW